MQRAAKIVLVTTIITAGYVCGVVVAHAAARIHSAQMKGETPTPGDACSLLTKQDAAAALGETVSGPESSSGRSVIPGATASSCEYAGAGLHNVHLNLWRDTTAQFQQIYRALCAAKGKEGLSGLGDVACWYSEKHEELQVLKGATLFIIELRRSGDPTEAIKGVAKRVLDQLR